MNNKAKLNIALPLIVVTAIVLGMAIGFKLREGTRPAGGFIDNTAPSSLNEIVRIIDKNYVDKIDANAVKNDAVNSFLHQLDAYSSYLTPLEAQVFNEEMQGNFKGIGIDYEKINDTLHILSITENSPAERSGMLVGDHIIKLNDIDVTFTHQPGFDFRTTLREQIKKSNNLNFTISRNNQIKQIPVTASIVPLPSVNVAHMLNAHTGLIKLGKFSETSYVEFMTSADSLIKSGMKNLIIDLRGNAGGLMEQANQIAGEFFPANTLIFSTEDRTGKKEFRTIRDGILKDLKLAVLVDESTASSSEIFAGAMQDYDRAIIAGKQTYGKALVQNLFRLTNGGAIRISVARYFTPLGRNIQINHNGADTSAKKQEYTTKLGKKLHAFSGIQPDILIATDSLAYPEEVREFYVKGLLSQHVYKYFIAHQNELKKYASPQEFSQNFNKDDTNIWKGIVDFGSMHGYDFAHLNNTAKQELLNTFNAFLGRQIWHNPGYFIVSNYNDPVVLKTAALLNQ